METVIYKDDNGSIITVKQHEGINYWPGIIGDPKDHIQNVQGMKCRPDDVFITAYPKTGTHWVAELVTMLVNSKLELSKTAMNNIDFIPLNDLDAMLSPRVLASHWYFRYLPRDIKQNGGKIIHLTRNPKDTAVSYYCMMKNLIIPGIWCDFEWRDFLPLFLEGKVPCNSWFDYMKDWEECIAVNPSYPILQIKYEDLKQDLLSNVKKISKFLGLGHEDEFLMQVAMKCEFKVMSKEKNISENIPVQVSKYSRDGTDFHYRKGEVGDWKNWFTVAQNENFDEYYKQKMKNTHYSPSYTLQMMHKTYSQL